MTHHGRYSISPGRAGAVFGETNAATVAPRFLVVDDHALIRHGLALALRIRFPAAAVFEAGSLAEASRRVRSVGNLSAVLYDLQMGDTDGLPGVEAMLEMLDGVPLIVVSASPDTRMIASCIRAGARGFLPKGSNPEVLDHALPIVLGGGIYAPLPQPIAAVPEPITLTPGAPAGDNPVAQLTERQREVLTLLLQGQSNKEIARSLGVLEGTVKVHLRSVMQRLGVRNRTQLALMAAKAGMPI